MRYLVLIYISEFIRIHGYSPSIREISKDLERSTSTIMSHIKKLKELGMIDYVPGKNRTIVIKER